MVKNSTSSQENNLKDQVGTSHLPSGTASESLTENLQEYSPEKLNAWIESEAKLMDSTHNDTQVQQVKLRAQAQTLSPQQLKNLTEVALKTSEPVNQRIFSAYLMTLNRSDLSQDQMFELAKADIIDDGPILPHSETELKHSQELALRYMQVDELFERAKTDSNAFNKLKLLAQEAQSAQVRSYAERKLHEIK